MKKAIIAGSFDPLHKGHIHIIDKARKLFDLLYVVVANNPEKDQRSTSDRVNGVKKILGNKKNVEVISMEYGKLADLAKELDVNYLVRSARDSTDFSYELMMAKQNKIFNNDLETILIMPDKIHIEVRSSLLKIKTKPTI